MERARVDHIVGGIHRISIWSPEAGLTFNQFLIDDEAPTLVHTGRYDDNEAVAGALAASSQLVGSALSIALNAYGFGIHARTLGFRGGETLDLGEHRLRFLETPHVHHWDSMMVVEEKTNSVFPSDLYLQPGEQPPVSNENLAEDRLEAYRMYGIFAHEDPVRAVARQIEALAPKWIHAMHGATITGDALHHYTQVLLNEPFAYRGLLFGRAIGAQPARGG